MILLAVLCLLVLISLLVGNQSLQLIGGGILALLVGCLVISIPAYLLQKIKAWDFIVLLRLIFGMFKSLVTYKQAEKNSYTYLTPK